MGTRTRTHVNVNTPSLCTVGQLTNKRVYICVYLCLVSLFYNTKHTFSSCLTSLLFQSRCVLDQILWKFSLRGIFRDAGAEFVLQTKPVFISTLSQLLTLLRSFSYRLHAVSELALCCTCPWFDSSTYLMAVYYRCTSSLHIINWLSSHVTAAAAASGFTDKSSI